MRSEGLDLRSKRHDLWSERPDLGSERPDVGSERDLGACLRLGGKVHRKPEKIALCGYILVICPPQPLPPQKKITIHLSRRDNE